MVAKKQEHYTWTIQPSSSLVSYSSAVVRSGRTELHGEKRLTTNSLDILNSLDVSVLPWVARDHGKTTVEQSVKQCKRKRKHNIADRVPE